MRRALIASAPGQPSGAARNGTAFAICLTAMIAGLSSPAMASAATPFEPATIYRNHNACIQGVSGTSVLEVAHEHANKTKEISPTACSSQCTNQADFAGLVGSNGYRTKSRCTGSTFTHFATTQSTPKNNGPDCGPDKPCTGANPINPATGNKYQLELDFQSAGPMPLTFERHYNSNALDSTAITDSGLPGRTANGVNWRNTYDRSINHIPELTPPIVKVMRHTGRVFRFRLENNEWKGEADVRGELVEYSNGWEFTDANEVTEQYDLDGKLVAVSRTRGNFLTQTLHYDSRNRLKSVAGPFGRSLTFTYDGNGRLSTMTDPTGAEYAYRYARDNLVAVVYPDNTPADDTDNPVRTYHYENPSFPNALTGITDERGIRFATYAYDAQGRGISSEHAGGANRYRFAYNADGTTTVTDPLGQERVYSFANFHDAAKNTGITGGRCATCGPQPSAITYDANGYPSTTTDFNGIQTILVHDERGLETSRTEAVGTPEERTITTRWHSDFRLPTLITEPGKATAFTYDAAGRLLSRTETDVAGNRSRTITNTYTSEALLETTDGPRTDVTDVTTFSYDTEGNLTEVVNALGHKSLVTAYDANGRPLSATDPNGLVTLLAYDARGRLTSRDVGGRVTTLDRDAIGNIVKTTLPDGSFLALEHDDARRLVAVEDALGNRMEYGLDPVGNRTQEVIKDSGAIVTRTQSRSFDALNRLVQEIGGAGQQTDYEYDTEGNLTAIVDGNGGRTTNAYDPLNRTAKVIDPELGETDFGYDPRDNLVSVTDAEGLSTLYSYDGLENLTAIASPDTGTTSFTHDEAGNRITQIDARGILMNFYYDSLNRLTNVEYPDPEKDTSFHYDTGPNGTGRLTRMTDAGGNTDFEYDIRGNLVSETRTIDDNQYQTTYAYDLADRVSSITYPSGTIVTYARDTLGRVSEVTTTTAGSTQVIATNVAYLPFGPMESLDYGNGIPLDRTFDKSYRLSSQTAGFVQDLTLTYDSADNITAKLDGLDSMHDQSFAYDGLNRLVHAQGVYGTRAYDYDSIGNRLSRSSGAGLDTYLYASDSHRLESISGPNAASFAYDANGNTTAKGPLTFNYDDTNRMTEVMASGVQIASYSYNAKGERVKKVLTGGMGTIADTVLFSDDFSTPDGTIIDDQPGGAWRGKRPKSNVSATSEGGRARIAKGEIIRTAQLFEDTGDATLKVTASLARGALVFKHPGEPRGIKVRFNGNRRVVVTSGDFDDKSNRSRTLFKLTQPSAQIRIELSLRAGVTTATVIDGQGHSYNTGQVTNPTMAANENYRLKLRAITVGNIAVTGIADDVSVVRSNTKTGETSHFLYDSQGHLIAELDDKGNTVVEYFHLDGSLIGTLRGAHLYYAHTDHLGTPTSLTDQSGVIAWRGSYTPFGSTIKIEDSVRNLFRFPGQYFDAETGLHYNYFRNYDPSTGRYLISDPVGLLGGPNTYLYVNANPTGWHDRTGLLRNCESIVLGLRQTSRTRKEQKSVSRQYAPTVQIMTESSIATNIDPRKPRQIPIKPAILLEIWWARRDTFTWNEYLENKTFQRLKVFCEHISTDKCGKERRLNTVVDTEKLVSETKEFLRTFQTEELVLIQLLFRAAGT